LEEQIDQLYEKRVPLPSGGSLVIEPTEALVSIDVNSGKSSGERGVEDTAFKTNMEAAAEVARQLRLRDLGGLVVIDFIDMRDTKHNKEVEQTLKDALKMDKARVNLGRISQFGMMEMSRQRIAKNINDAIHLECPHCEGRGRVKSVEAMAVSFLRKVHAAAAKGQIAEVRGGLPLEVAYFLLNRKKRELAQIENDYEIVVTVKGKPSFLLNQLELEVIRREKPLREEAGELDSDLSSLIIAHDEAYETPVAVAEPQAEGIARKKRKRKRKKKTGSAEPPAEQTAQQTTLQDEAPDVLMAEISTEDQPEHALPQKRRRSRSRKKGVATKEVSGTPAVAETDSITPTVEQVLEQPVEQEPLPQEKKKPGRPATRPRKTATEETPVEVAAEPLPKPVKAKKAVSATAKRNSNSRLKHPVMCLCLPRRKRRSLPGNVLLPNGPPRRPGRCLPEKNSLTGHDGYATFTGSVLSETSER